MEGAYQSRRFRNLGAWLPSLEMGCCLLDEDMHKILLSLVALFGMGTEGFAQDTLRGVYQPPGSAWPTAASAGKSGKASQPTLEAPNYGPVGGPVDAPPAVTIPGGPVGGPVDARPAVTVPGTVSQGAQPPNAPDCQIVNGAVGCGNKYISGQAYGGQLYFSNGTTGTRYGSQTYFSDGTTGTTYGNTTYLSNGKVCHQSGGQLNCN